MHATNLFGPLTLVVEEERSESITVQMIQDCDEELLVELERIRSLGHNLEIFRSQPITQFALFLTCLTVS